MLAAYRRSHSPSPLVGMGVDGHLALSLHSSNELGEFSQWPRHNGITINIVIGIFIIIVYRSVLSGFVTLTFELLTFTSLCKLIRPSGNC